MSHTQAVPDLPPPPTLPGPGWYEQGGTLRWWDGQTWGPSAPGRQLDEVESEKSIAVLAHVGLFILPVFLALIFRQTVGKRNRFVRHHATEALNFQLVFAVIWNAVGISMFVLMAASSDDGTASGWFSLVILCMLALHVAVAVLSIRGAMRANRGVWWRYPLSIRLVRGAVRIGADRLRMTDRLPAFADGSHRWLRLPLSDMGQHRVSALTAGLAGQCPAGTICPT